MATAPHYQPQPGAAVVGQPMPQQRPTYQQHTTTVVTTVRDDDRTLCSCLGNVLWLILGGGVFIALVYCMAGLLFCITIVGIPCGIQLFKLGGLALAPFGVHLEGRRFRGCNCGSCMTLIANLVWLPFGICLFFLHVMFGILSIIIIIGCCFGWHEQHFKLATLAIMPFGTRLDATSDRLIIGQVTTNDRMYAQMP